MTPFYPPALAPVEEVDADRPSASANNSAAEKRAFYSRLASFGVLLPYVTVVFGWWIAGHFVKPKSPHSHLHVAVGLMTLTMFASYAVGVGCTLPFIRCLRNPLAALLIALGILANLAGVIAIHLYLYVAAGGPPL
jgi:hypothetical protein